MEAKPKNKSKYYSRRGCINCKHAHVKCDEKNPICGRCLKRKTQCEYAMDFQVTSANELNNNFKINKKSKPKSSVFQIINETEKISSTPMKSTENLFNISIMNKKTEADGQVDSDSKISTMSLNKVLGSRYYMKLKNSSASEASDHGSQYSFSNININDLISIKQNDLIYQNFTNGGNELAFSFHNEAFQPNLHMFHIPWDGGPLVYFKDTIEQHDPMLFNENTPFNGQNMIDFVWTMTRITKIFYSFVLYSETSLLFILELFFKLGTKSPIFHNIMTYHCALHVIKVYTEVGHLKAANIWDQKVRIPAFRKCIENIKEGLEKDPTFSNTVILTFAVLSIFSGNVSDRSWSTHLNGSHQLINKCLSLSKDARDDDPFDNVALNLLDVIIEWYEHIKHSAALTSLNGFWNKKLKLKSIYKGRGFRKNAAIADNNINLMSGHCLELNTIISDIYDFMFVLEQNNVRLSGLNFVYFLLNPNDQQIIKTVQTFGNEILKHINYLIREYEYIRLDLEDVRMDLSVRYCNMLYMYGVKLYVTFFFVGEKDTSIIKPLLRDIIDLIYSMPYRSSCARICHWCIYTSALVSLMIEDYNLYGHFLGMLKVFQLNGMEIPSFNLLEKIKVILIEKEHWKLLLPENDIVIY